MKIKIILWAILIGVLGCKSKSNQNALFESLSSDVTNIDFTNDVVDDGEFNIFNYRNFYNGGGVAIGDVNNDNLPDVFLISNMGENKLYLNKGKFEFEDITDKAGVGGKKAWSTGVTFADVNGDGLLDIYVCNAGNRSNDDRTNELFINKGNLTFEEKAEAYNLADPGFSTHAAFFDYDRDGDLDMFLLNNSFIPVGSLQYQNIRNQRDSLGGHKLFRNELVSASDTSYVSDGKQKKIHFTDVSEQAGIYGSIIGFGLGITIGDVNNDNWLDIYVSNDFYERDYLYINNKNGTFSESIKDQMPHISLSSMGADIADINNDGELDIFVTDMLPWNDERLKRTSTFESYELFELKRNRDFHRQQMHNMLQLNNGDGTFSEVSRLSKVHATDWSWGALIFDMDNDGLKDIFVANGIAKDLTDQDFINFLADEKNIEQMANGKKFNFEEFLDKISSNPISNYAFKNLGDLKFENKAEELGLGEPSFSNGSAYGDLDNDGDLDLIVNNVNSPVSIFRNRTNKLLKNNFLKVQLGGKSPNVHGIGTKVKLYQNGKVKYLQQMPNRGFESSVDLVLVFGLGKDSKIDSVEVIWPDDKMQVIYNVKPGSTLKVDISRADRIFKESKIQPEARFEDFTQKSGLNYRHEENLFVDYNRDGLLKQMYSTSGPALASGDINGDGLEDLFFGGAKDKAKAIYLQQKNGSFIADVSAAVNLDTAAEAVDAAFMDIDNDSDLDLFIVTGGNEFQPDDPLLFDLLYINDGKGNFKKDENFPKLAESGSCIAASDFDLDGDVDLFVGNRLIPGRYGYDPASHLFINNGKGEFKNYTKRYLPQNELGMVTDALWEDLNGDKYPELILVGDWMPITVFSNKGGRSLNLAAIPGLKNSEGWWNCVAAEDLDGDGDRDLILGNLGLNSKVAATVKNPAELYVKDFDKNGTVEQIITCVAEDGKNYPMVLKHSLQKQLPVLKKKFLKYSDYAGKQIHEIFTEDELKGALYKKAHNFNSSILLNQGSLQFKLESLPLEAQFSPINSIQTLDYNQDGRQDLILAGNFLDVLPEMGQYDASYGLILEGDGKGGFKAIKPRESGFFVKGQVRKMTTIKDSQKGVSVVVAKNNDSALLFRLK